MGARGLVVVVGTEKLLSCCSGVVEKSAMFDGGGAARMEFRG